MSLRIASANIDFALHGDPRYLAWVCERADVLLLQEAKNVRLADVLPDGWISLQDTSGATQAEREAHMGAAIAVKDETVAVDSHHLTLGAKPYLPGSVARRVGMLPRHIAVASITERATGRPTTPISAHFPPPRFSALQPGFEKRLRAIAARHRSVVIGTDANQPVAELADRMGLHCAGRGIVGLLSTETLHGEQVRPWGIRQHVTDHPAVLATVHLKETR